MRVSDAERAEVADRLAQHYSDGRLDQAEFNERIDQAMRAKIRSDLSWLLADLPGNEPPKKAPEASKGSKASRASRAPEAAEVPQPVARPRQARPQHRLVELALIVVVAVIAVHALVGYYVPWLLIGILALLWLRYGSRHPRR